VYEHRRQPLLPRRSFLSRLTKHALVAAALFLATLVIGMAGYHVFAGLPWVDAYLNAAMILGGMGPVAELRTTAAKVFAGTYALFAGTVFLAGVGVILAPIIHRTMHHFHVGDGGPGAA
jgi:hypothetical protein